VKAPFSFSEKECHIFVLEYLPGGDLRKMLDDEVYFEESKAQFYLAEIVLAIEHLHQSEIIHRDLKP
jgi:protein-serine/threonine kinase